MTLPTEDRTLLISLARAAVEAEVSAKAPPKTESLTGVLAQRRGCFITLTNAGRLRGCMGTFKPMATLGEIIAEMGAAAARDPRFVGNPITPRELPELRIEVSVLSPLAETFRPASLTVGTHGIYIVRDDHSGCFLPEVATDQGWDAEEFLTQCCQSKAALPPNAWKDPTTKVYIFTSEKFDQ